ncbi:MAG: hypothetical protein C4520_14065 [Candidatus Abyssobacteria bacterium SURF_5]|uniref:Uncharacterized protein n=1 Tax=Abyssobacteria bacterium (strain SURF_5) TaxID=2093360 RepID=A0A3A4NKN0_ABYX5|nr:MAG: hypothetical protein C4520_14065 [Candidatus Abyssubacteria bacterium SURF_5]
MRKADRLVTPSAATRRRSPKREHQLLGSTHADKSGAGATRFFLNGKEKGKGKKEKAERKSRAKPNPRECVVIQSEKISEIPDRVQDGVCG